MAVCVRDPLGGSIGSIGRHTSPIAIMITTATLPSLLFATEHGHTPESYVADFDAIVQGIRRHADPNHTIAFVGMNNPNIDDADTVTRWANFFLNASNHAEDVRDTKAIGTYIGYHAYPTSHFPMRTKDDLWRLFAYVDDFIDNKAGQVLGSGSLFYFFSFLFFLVYS